jgi:hypothetical protein
MGKATEVKITSKILERLASGKTVVVRLPKDADTLTIILDREDDFSHFDRVFSKLWKSVLKKIEKAVA